MEVSWLATRTFAGKSGGRSVPNAATSRRIVANCGAAGRCVAVDSSVWTISYDPAMRKQIAIVEDEPALRENYAAALARQGYQVKAYGNRKTAMQAFEAHLPDLAIIDI